MGKGFKIFLTVDIIYILVCLVLIIIENNKKVVGLPALSSLGSFVVYIIMLLAGLVALLFGIGIKIFINNK